MIAEQVGDDALLLGLRDVGRDRLGIERRGIDVEAVAGLQYLADQEADRERERRHRLEIEQRLDADAADLLEIAHRGDAVHDGAEDHRRDHHLDQRDEAVAERLELPAEVRIEIPDEDAERDRDQHLDVEDRVPGMTGRACQNRTASETFHLRLPCARRTGSLWFGTACRRCGRFGVDRLHHSLPSRSNVGFGPGLRLIPSPRRIRAARGRFPRAPPRER